MVPMIKKYVKKKDKLSKYEALMREGSSGIRNHLVPKTGDMALKRFKALKEGENFHKLQQELKDNYADPGRTQNSIYLRLDRKKPSGTVINVRKSMWVHPTKHRAISVERLQGYNHFLTGSYSKGLKTPNINKLEMLFHL